MTDWGELIMDVQTEPDGSLASSSADPLYREIYPYLLAVALDWQRLRHVQAEHPDDLVSLGIQVLFERIDKFTIPEADNANVGKAFKGWVSVIAKREWDRFLSSKKPDVEYLAPTNLDELQVEIKVDTTEFAASPQSQKMKSILNEELSKLPEHMRNAILETVSEKGTANSRARIESGITRKIAEKYGYTPTNVRTNISRLKKRVQTRMSEET